MPNDLPATGPALPRAAADAGGSGPAELYRERVDAGFIHADPAQQRVVVRLQQLHEQLRDYRPPIERRGLLGWLGLGEATPVPLAPDPGRVLVRDVAQACHRGGIVRLGEDVRRFCGLEHG